ncbi:MAG: hypothetical protein ACTHKS_01925 [Gaiellaceae bacterium]
MGWDIKTSSSDDSAGLDVTFGAQQDRSVCMRTRADDDRLVSERDHHERSWESILRMAARFHLRFSLASRAEVHTKQVRRCAGTRVIAHLEHAADDQFPGHIGGNARPAAF